jgi:Asp-tRNA(Asn)/Glu-tRNA(Gln) amidotransferase A subunit family amidase
MTLRNTTLGNIFNLPGVAMPMNSAQMKDHRPTSLLVSTHAGRDDQLIEVARICEDILNRGES